jgi:hypothetical protein
MASLKIRFHQYPKKKTQVLCSEINNNKYLSMKKKFKKQKAK